jgi:hypothetical protein
MADRCNLYLSEFKTCSCTQVHRWGEGLGYCRRHGTDRRRLTKIPESEKNRWLSELENDDDGFACQG